MREAVIVAATRTAVGRRKGGFADVRPDDLLADILELSLGAPNIAFSHRKLSKISQSLVAQKR